MGVADDPQRRFVFAPDLKKLGDRVTEAEKAAEQARELYEDMVDSDDLLVRIAHLVLCVRELRAERMTADELAGEARRTLDGIRRELPDHVLAELGPEFNSEPDHARPS